MDATDSELLARLRHRDPAALDEVARRYRGRVYATALRRVRDPHTADDVTQTVFLRLVERAPRMSHDVKLAGWLTTTATYCASETLRAARRRGVHERHAAALTPSAYEPTDPVVADEARATLIVALRELGTGDRRALGLRFDDGASVNRVGEHLGISTDAAAKRVGRALQRLRGALHHRSAAAVAR